MISIPARVTAADQKALNPSIGRTSRLKCVPGEPICGLYSDQPSPSSRLNSVIMIRIALGIFQAVRGAATLQAAPGHCLSRDRAYLRWMSRVMAGLAFVLGMRRPFATRDTSMSSAPQTQDDDAERGADRQADAMTAQLRKDADSWSRARRDSPPGYITEFEPTCAQATLVPAAHQVQEAQRSDARCQADGHTLEAG